jgi:uroporphyrin-III C-methyltransferase
MNGEATTAQPAEPALLSEPGAARREVGRGATAMSRIAVLLALVALAIAGWQWRESRVRSENLHSELARRLVEDDNIAKESRIVSKQAQEAVAALQAKVGALEAKLGESQSQQVALSAVYQDLRGSRDDRALAEVEQAVNLAAQQLQLAGNVAAALIALQSADARLARTEQPQFLALRKALNQDMARLKALPLADIPGLALKIESVARAVDAMPLAFEGKGRGGAAKTEPAADRGFWVGFGLDLWKEISQLVRIERLDRPDPAVLSPQNAFILRENLRLRLLSARLALLQREAQTYREDIGQARVWIGRYFDTKAKGTEDALATLDQLSGARLNPELPTLDDSLTALRNLKLSRDKSGMR